jgi:hypothetical protein
MPKRHDNAEGYNTATSQSVSQKALSVDWDLNFVVVRELHCDRTAVSTVPSDHPNSMRLTRSGKISSNVSAALSFSCFFVFPSTAPVTCHQLGIFLNFWQTLFK